MYGIPSVFLAGPPNASTDREKVFHEIAELLINDGRGYLPNGSDIQFVNGGGGRPPFLEHIEYLDRQMVIAATGGLLRMLAESGSGTLAGGAHTETFMQIACSDAVTLSAVLQRDIDKPLLDAIFLICLRWPISSSRRWRRTRRARWLVMRWSCQRPG